MTGIGKILVVFGLILLIAGIIIWIGGDRFGWFGNLPGDIRVERRNFSFYFPLTSMVVLSVVLSLVIWLIRKLFI
jgi:uncharacterized protein HemY